MGRERTEYIVYNRPFESFKMIMRLIYGVLIWYEFVWEHKNMLNYVTPDPENDQSINIKHKTPFWIGSGIQLFIEFIDIVNTSRMLSTMPFMLFIGAYIALYS